ncbi:MAG: hypothetical protein H6659_18105 [Ardenticatenaceae bacterium]|nr:hypothetical protein [Anaerolineales bacterium]MCB8985747.1 hypothetical protein [Ardenticatenaceae bacterium]
MKFKEWLLKQKERKDSVGTLARALADVDPRKFGRDSRRRKPDEHRRWARIVTRYGTMAHVQAFNQAWREFSKTQASREKTA